MAAARTALFFDIFATNKTGRAFKQIIGSTDTLKGKIAAVGKLAAVSAAAGLAVFAAKGVKSFLQFDDAMTQSLAIMGEVSGPMREQMETAAREVGKTTRFGASQAAEAYFFLASAGLDAQQSVAAMPQVAKFAQAGMFDLARATDLATDAQSALGLSVDDPRKNLENLTRVTDVLVGANTLANASVEQFSESLTGKAGPALRQANVEIETGVAVLALYADQGLKGERASSVLAGTLEQLQRNAINNADEFERLGISVFDSQGNMRNLVDVTTDLDGALGGMSLEQQKSTLMQLGFNRTALEGIQRLIGYSGELGNLEGALQSMGGITEEVADKQLQSFAARLDLIKSQIADAALVVGGVLVNAVFNVGEHIGEMVDMFGQLPGGMQIGIGALAALAAGAPVAVGAFRKIRGAIQAAQLAMVNMSRTARLMTLSMGAVGLLLAAGATVLAFFANRNLEAKARVDALADSLDKQTGALTDNTREIAFNNLAESGAIDKAKELGISLDTLTSAYLGEQDAIDQVNAVLADNIGKTEERTSGGNSTVAVLTDEAKAARDVKDAIREGNEETDEAIVKSRDHAEAVGETADADDELADAAAAATIEIEDQTSAIEELISELDEMVSTIFAARDAERSYEEALDDATEAAKENGATLDITTEKGRDNQEQLDRLAESALKDAAATLEDAEAKGDLAAGHDEATAKMQIARAEFIKVARQMGLSETAAGELADELGLIPGNYEATVEADTSDAMAKVRSFRELLNSIPRSQQFTLRARAIGPGGLAKGGFAARGTVEMVGEEGPELVAFGQDAHVFTAPQTRQMMRGGDGAAAIGSAGPLTIENHIEIGGEVVRVVRTEISTHDRGLRRRANSGTGRAR
jgi:TP901 family phage tail tape measure protein